MDTKIKKYQLAVFISPLLDEKQQKELITKIKKWISENKGETADEKISKKNLSYKIKHFQNAFYVLLDFSLSPSSLIRITDNLKLENDILRYMILATPKKKMAKKKTARIVRKKSSQNLLVENLISKNKDKTENVAEVKQKEKAEPKEKLDLADLDKKLDEILND